jgi:hypothetical protein
MKLDIDKSLFLSFHTHCLSSSAGCFGVLPSYLEAPFVSDTLVASDLVQSFNVFSQLCFKNVGCDLQVLAFLVILLSVQKPSRYAVSFRVGDNVGDTITLGFSQLTGSEPGVDSEDFADEESKSSSDTFDFIESVWDCAFPVDVGVENTVDMLEGVVSVFDDE